MIFTVALFHIVTYIQEVNLQLLIFNRSPF